jgi:hypothetical protein
LDGFFKQAHHKTHNCAAFVVACFDECQRLGGGGSPVDRPPLTTDEDDSRSEFGGDEAAVEEVKRKWSDPTLGEKQELVLFHKQKAVWTPYSWIMPGGCRRKFAQTHTHTHSHPFLT